MSSIQNPAARISRRSFLLSFGLGLMIQLQAVSAAPVTLSIGDAMVQEGNSGTRDLLFNVQREAGSDLSSNVVIPYTVLPSGVNPATAGVDYVAPPANASLRIPAGQSVQTLHVSVKGDTTPEADETLQVQFGEAAAFAPGAYFPMVLRVGANPRSIASADFDGDGINDLVVANFDAGNLSILRGKATGGFATAYTVDGYQGLVRFAAAGDFTGDGKPDLALANESLNSVNILRNDGAGGFTLIRTTAVGTKPLAIATADFNHDGKLDFAVVNNTSNTVTIELGNGNGGFPQVATVAVGSGPIAITAVDLNGDGAPDLAVVNQTSANVSVLLNNGAGAFTLASTPAVGSGPVAIAAGDVSGDGKPDLAIANMSANTVSVLRNTGAGSFALIGNAAVGTGPAAVALRDVNHDGHLDLITGNRTSSDVTIRLGNGASGFGASTTVAVTGAAAGVLADDFDGDANVDLAVVNNSGNTVSLLPGDGAGNFRSGVGGGPSASFPANGFAAAVNLPVANADGGITVGDFNGDGIPDLAVTKFGINQAAVLLGQGAGSFGAPIELGNVGSNPIDIAAGDFNGDGKIDLATANETDDTVSVLQGDGAAGFTPIGPYFAPSSPQSIVAADLDGNGTLELVTSGQNSDTVTVVGDLFYRVAVGSAPTAVAAGDFDGDGDLDLAVADFGSDDIAILPFASVDTGPVLKSSVSTGQGSGPDAIATGDFDGDGRLDLVSANSGGNTVSILHGDGLDNFVVTGNRGVGRHPSAVVTGDFDGDGYLDIAVANQFDNNISILRGNNTGEFAPRVNFATSTSPAAMLAADLDGDGDLDLAVLNQDGNISILLNQSAQPVVISDGTATGTILNDDGAVDATPDGFRFTDVTGAPISTSLRSNSITVSGINAPAPLVLSGPADAAPQYSINGAGFKYYNLRNGQPTVSNGDTVQLRARSSATGGATVDLNLSIGSVSDTWSLSTAATASTPNAFDFKDKTNQPANRYIGSGGVRISGINTPVAISINGDPSASFRINSGGYIAGPATVSNGDLVVLRLKSSATPGASVSAVVSIGGVSDGWTVTTAP